MLQCTGIVWVNCGNCSVAACVPFGMQVLGCWVLFCAANVAKALVAKKMASHFHKQTHFQKMRDAIKKVKTLLPMYKRLLAWIL